jgi:glutamine synthetase
MSYGSGFIARHGLWSDDDRRLAEDIMRRVEAENLNLIRLVWADPHGYSRAKSLTVAGIKSALESGYNINVATTTLDSAGARTFSSFVRGGGMGLDEMSGSPNLTIVPDPTTFRILPWAPRTGWILCDEYFNDGRPFHFSPRQLLRKALKPLEARGLKHVVGLEIEWYLLRVAGELGPENIGAPGVRGKPIATAPIEPGYHYHSETNMDLMQPVLSALTDGYEALGLPLRSIENEWGPGQVECTFAPRDALTAADNVLIFRTATRQICRRMGHFATFMTRPGIKGLYSSGWHLHQSLVDARSGRNVFMPDNEGACLSPTGLNYLGGLLEHAVPSSVFATPTVNGYRRFKPNSLAPDRASWGYDHRGAMVRVLGGPDDPATRMENRMGEPSANPYLFILSQIVCGLAGIDAKSDPGAQDDEPYAAKRTPLPTNLLDALTALEGSKLYRDALGDVFIDYYLKLKRNEAGRHQRFMETNGGDPDEVSQWEQNEYFDFF